MVSIPIGSIKTRKMRRVSQGVSLFQFQLVRLKPDAIDLIWKESVSFNSNWFD